VVSYVDLRDDPVPEPLAHDTSTLFPRKADSSADVLCDYAGFYTDAFAKRLGFRDPRDPNRFLNLHELIGFGIVNEMWFYAIHGKAWPGLETIEFKRYYDERLEPVKDKYGPAGNGHDSTMPWSGRSFRIAFFNPHRGIGCAMENVGHTLEGIANYGAIEYYRKYFNEYAELDLDRRYGLPFSSLYALGEGDFAAYPGEAALEIHRRGEVYRIAPYDAMGGNVHFPPGGRRHYDKDSPHRVKSVIESYRLRGGPDGKDRVREFRSELFARYEQVAPDCMGSWVVRWCQCMPGLGNRSVDDEGRPMKNWWPFLFY
jgi:hypothetical protein